MRTTSVKVDGDNKALLDLSIEDITNNIFRFRFERFEDDARTVCSENILSREDLEKVRDSINYMLGEEE